MRFLRYGLIAAAALLLPTAAGAQPAAATPAAPGEWVKITPQPVRIAGRLYTPTCSQAFGSKGTYSYWYRKGTGDGLAVFFNGGGACWNAETCSKARFEGSRANFGGKTPADAEGVYKAALMPGDGPAHMGGLLDRGDARNPIRDWSVVFVPYCTGDVHSGSNTARYRDPATGKPFSIQHRGWDNMQVVLHWMRETLPAPARLLVTGSSAGAYGAATHYAAVRGLYPRASAVFLGDSGQGVSTPAFEKTRNANWNYQLPKAVFGPDPQRTPDAEEIARLAAHFPADRFAQFTSAHDATQTAFYAAMGAPRTCNAWTNAMLRELTPRQAVPNFRVYVAEGATHTILRAPLFYTETSGGAPFTTWLGGLLNGPAPENRICTNCLAPPPGCTP